MLTAFRDDSLLQSRKTGEVCGLGEEQTGMAGRGARNWRRLMLAVVVLTFTVVCASDWGPEARSREVHRAARAERSTGSIAFSWERTSPFVPGLAPPARTGATAPKECPLEDARAPTAWPFVPASLALPLVAPVTAPKPDRPALPSPRLISD